MCQGLAVVIPIVSAVDVNVNGSLFVSLFCC